MDNPRTFLAVLAGAAAITAALVGASVISATRTESRDAAGPRHGLLDGIQQHGLAIGSPRAPVTLVEYADLQCPYCAAWTRETLPVLLTDYVRRGRLRIVFHGLAFLGPDSSAALAASVAAARQDHLWDVLDGLYERQQAENSGWFTQAVLDEVVAGVHGLDAARLDRERRAGWTGARIRAAAAAANRTGVRGTPSFQIGPTGGPLRLVALTSLGPEGLRPAIDALLGG